MTVVVTMDSTRVWITTDDGGFWNLDTTATPTAKMRGLAFGAGTWVAVGDLAGSDNVWTSVDAQTWTPYPAGASTLAAVVFVP